MTEISILIHTKNEQQDLPGCLQSVSWSDDIHVFDSGSTDETIAIALKFGAKVTERTYAENNLAYGGDEAGHRNWGLQNIHFKYPWIYLIDADERMTVELVQAVQSSVAFPVGNSAFQVQRHDFLLGTWLKHVTPSPFNVRLFRHRNVRYERLVNSSIVVDGTIGKIESHFDHFPFSKGMSNWVDRHNRYSTSEAAQIVSNKKMNADFRLRKAFLPNNNKNERRFHQKELYYRLPFRPLLMFGLLYILKGGFLDGRAGFTFALLRSFYEYMIVLKVHELETAALATKSNPTLGSSLDKLGIPFNPGQ